MKIMKGVKIMKRRLEGPSFMTFTNFMTFNVSVNRRQPRDVTRLRAQHA